MGEQTRNPYTSGSCQPARLLEDITSLHRHVTYRVELHHLCIRFIIVTLTNLIPLSSSLPAWRWQEIKAFTLFHFSASVNSMCQPLESSNAVVYKVKNHLLPSPNPCSTTGPSGKSIIETWHLFVYGCLFVSLCKQSIWCKHLCNVCAALWFLAENGLVLLSWLPRIKYTQTHHFVSL